MAGVGFKAVSDDLKRLVVEQLRESRKYRTVSLATMERIAEWAVARSGSPKEIVKNAKRKLHQVYGAYLDPSTLKRAEELVGKLHTGMDMEQVRSVCREILSCHASTRERLPILDVALDALREALGPFSSVSDLACGLNPFCLPWLDPSGEIRYLASDIDDRLVAVINRFLECMGRSATAASHDILCGNPPAAEVVLLFKVLPSLERQEKGAAEKIILRLAKERAVRKLVVSFPSHSLGGHGKGMEAHYGGFIESIAGQLGLSFQRFPYSTEIFYILAIR